MMPTSLDMMIILRFFQAIGGSVAWVAAVALAKIVSDEIVPELSLGIQPNGQALESRELPISRLQNSR
jgi:hypothetical protein